MKLGVVGLGARIASLLPLFIKSAPDARIVAVAAPQHDRTDALAQLGASPKRYAAADEMLAAHRFDLLLIGSPNHLHLDHLVRALRTETPFIFAEKPVVISVQESLALARAIVAHEGLRRLMVGMVLRYSPLYRALIAARDDGLLGPIMSLEAAEHIAPYHGSFFMRDWRRQSGLSGGFMLEKCCHDLDLYQGVVRARARRVASFGGRAKFVPANRPAQPPRYLEAMAPRWGGTDDAFSGEADIVDHQCALVEYMTGASMAFHTNINVPDEYRRFAVIGRDGMAEGDFVRNTFRVTCAETGARLVNVDPVGTGNAEGHYGADEAMVRDMVAHMRGRLHHLALDVVDAFEAGLTALALDRARMAGTIIDLSADWTALDEALGSAAKHRTAA